MTIDTVKKISVDRYIAKAKVDNLHFQQESCINFRGIVLTFCM